MRNRLLHFLGVEKGEESMVSLLLSQSVFLGLFYGAFDISAHSLFLAVYDETIMARAYIISGLSGIFLTSLYAFFQTRMKFRNFAVINLIFVALVTLFLWMSLKFNPSNTIIFILFVLMGPLNILALLGFWGTSGRLFTLRQGKRLFGLVDVGLILGVILSSYAIPVMLTFGFNTHNIILLSAVAVFGASILQFLLGSRHTLGETASVRKGSVSKAMSLFRKDSYVLNMGIFVSLSVMVAFFVQYSFMAVTREQYPLEADMARFLGLFIGSMMIFTLFLKTFLFSYLIRNYGLKVLLLLPPLLILVFTAAASLLGSLLGYRPATGGFIIFFLILALSRLFSIALRDAVETPSFKVIYQTFDETERYAVQSLIDGTVTEIAALGSGLLLSILGIIAAGRLISFSFVLLVITIIWGYIGFRLYSEYRKAIIRSLEEKRSGTDPELPVSPVVTRMGWFHATLLIRLNYSRLTGGAFSLLEGDTGEGIARHLVKIAGVSNDFNLIHALEWIRNSDQLPADIRNNASETLAALRKGRGPYTDPFINVPVRKEAEELLRAERTPQPAMLLKTLRDNSPASRRSSLVVIGRHKVTDLMSEVCELLVNSDTSLDAASVLDSFGDSSHACLNRFLMRSSGNVPLMKSILDIMGKNSFHEASGLIYQMLRASSRAIRAQSVEILLEHQYMVPDSERDKMNQFISEIAGIITWHLQASVALVRADDSQLSAAIEQETRWWYDFLFKLLSVTYNCNYIVKIRENLEIATVESVNFALEMIDIVLDESIKAKIGYCVDITGNEEKLRSLYQFYPGVVPDYNSLLIEIINRDYNLISLWTKAIAVASLRNVSLTEKVRETLTALLFSPGRILVEEASKLLVEMDEDTLKGLMPRLPSANLEILEKVRESRMGEKDFLFSKIRFLKGYFETIPEDNLIEMAEQLVLLKPDDLSNLADDDMFLLPDGGDRHSGSYWFVRKGTPFENIIDKLGGFYRLKSRTLTDFLSFNMEFLEPVVSMTDNAGEIVQTS
jgi:ATP/ADP translocase